MASKHICRSCRQVLRSQRSQLHQRAQWLSHAEPSALRTFTTSRLLLQDVTPVPANPTQPPGTSRYSESQAKEQLPSEAERIALSRKLRRSLTDTKIRGTYEAYSITDEWMLGVQSVLGYDIPQLKSGEEVPKLEGGEMLGVPAGSGAEWYTELGLPVTFNTWAQLTMLHLYILQTRIRTLPSSSSQTYAQHLTDHFFTTAEQKMEDLHGIGSRGTRSKYLKDLFHQWRGVLASYDEGLVKGDAVLAGAVWRNLFGGSEDVNPVKLAMVVSWLRREVGRMGEEPDLGAWQKFGGLRGEENIVLMKSHLLDEKV